MPVTRRAAPLPVAAFALAALLPVPLIGLGLWAGGGWVWPAFLYMAVLSVMLDQLVPLVAGDAPEGAEFPAADAVLVAAGLSVLLLPVLTVRVLSDAGAALGAAEAVPLFLACGFWLGQVGHPAAHELIHRGRRGLFRLGVAAYVAMLMGHHASAHRLVHHRHVATAADPNSARAGEGFYRFALRAWIGSFRRGWQAESARRAGGKGRGLHPYAVYIGGAGAVLGLAWGIGGGRGMLIWAGLAAHAQAQILVSDYVQHYGLRRAVDAAGRAEPVGPQHSWNTPHWFTSAMMLNAPRHSDHHAHPARPYPALRLPPADEAPMLPWPLPLACTLALMPGLWRRIMAPHLAPWRVPRQGMAPPDRPQNTGA